MRVSVVGTGYVGLVTSVGLAEMGHEVVCVDLNADRIAKVQAGEPPFFEPGLADLLTRHIGRRLTATTDLLAAVVDSDMTLISVGTPFAENGIDLSAVTSAARAIGEILATKDEFHVVVVKSTVVPGTTDGIVLRTLEESSGKRVGRDFGVGVNPEFLTEGQAVMDFLAPDRIVLGAMDDRTTEALLRLYAPLPAATPRVSTNTRTAEMIKYASNSLLATMISFANEIGNLCAATGDVDVIDVQRGVHLSHYLTLTAADGDRLEAPITSFLAAGCGFGGSCLPKDVRALISAGGDRGQPMHLLRAVMEVNGAQPDEVIRLAEQSAGDLRGRAVTVLGLAFKPGTDDTRESPAIPIIERLLARGANVTVHDPVVTHLPPTLEHSSIRLVADLDAALEDSEVVVLVTRWDMYEELPLLLAGLDDPPIFLDGRRMLGKSSISRYAGIGL